MWVNLEMGLTSHRAQRSLAAASVLAHSVWQTGQRAIPVCLETRSPGRAPHAFFLRLRSRGFGSVLRGPSNSLPSVQAFQLRTVCRLASSQPEDLPRIRRWRRLRSVHMVHTDDNLNAIGKLMRGRTDKIHMDRMDRPALGSSVPEAHCAIAQLQPTAASCHIVCQGPGMLLREIQPTTTN